MEVKVDILKRVEGEGKLLIECENDFVKDIKLSIFELPRFIEPLLVGKSFEVLPEITARICEICPIYQVSAVKAVEYAFNVNISKAIDTLRKLFYFGEWIQSHALHIFFLHIPDFFGKSYIFEFDKDFIIKANNIKGPALF